MTIILNDRAINNKAWAIKRDFDTFLNVEIGHNLENRLWNLIWIGVDSQVD